MPDFSEIYTHHADQYQRLVAYEDYQDNLLRAIRAISPLDGLDVVETGAGTGRVTQLIAPYARSLRAFDLSVHMLQTARTWLREQGISDPQLAAANHRFLPVPDSSADLIISGWSFCYTYLDNRSEGPQVLAEAIANFHRILRSGGMIVVIETLGTGYEQPTRYPSISDYLTCLEDSGFQMTWIRTDFRFDNPQSARELIPFFFDDEMLASLKDNILPECTGLWWQEK